MTNYISKSDLGLNHPPKQNCSKFPVNYKFVGSSIFKQKQMLLHWPHVPQALQQYNWISLDVGKLH